VSRYWLRFRRFVFHSILHADDTPHALALGVSIGTLVAILPFIGLQTIVAVGLAALFRANKAVCVPLVWITNPLTTPPIVGLCLVVGRFIMGSPAGPPPHEVLSTLPDPPPPASWFSTQFWYDLVGQLMSLGAEWWVGSFVVGGILAAIAYPLTRWLVSAYRERHRKRLLQRQLFRTRIPATARQPA
jgi:uncharacterized protein (DUF2062 family)